MVRTPSRPRRSTLTVTGTRRGFRRLFAIAAFVVPFGVAFGAAAVDRGLSPFGATVMSALVFSGAAQFAALEFWPVPTALGSLALVALALNARHIIMGAALSPWLNELPVARRIAALSVLSDANFADTQSAMQSGERDVGILLGGGLALWSAWVLGTMIGAFGGTRLGDPAAYGIDVVMLCFFCAVVAGKVRQRWAAGPVASAAVVAVVTLGVLPAGWNVIAGALCGGVVSVIVRVE